MLSMRPLRLALCLIVSCFVVATLTACGSGGSKAPEPRASTASPLGDDAPRLILFLAVDQGAVEAIERYRPLLEESGGGLAMLYDRGTVFTDTHHAHAATETAPGHATLSTGRYPSGHGIIANYWEDPTTGRSLYSFGDPELGRSPRNLLVPTLGDWLKAAHPGARIYSFSGKDRAALAFAGRRGDAAFWYDRDSGTFTTSQYYLTNAPAWLDAFHDRRPAEEWFGTAWEPLSAVVGAGAEYRLANVDAGALSYALTFPHPLGVAATEPDEDYFGALYRTPYLDRLTARAAIAAIDGERLGTEGTTDLLAISFSALDTVGHAHGPDSPEYLDTLLRLDQTLAELFDAVDRSVGLEHVVISLSADHGVLPVPEVMSEAGADAARLDVEEIRCFQRVGQALDRQFGDDRWLAGDYGDLWISPAALARHGVERAAVEAAAADLFGGCPRVARVWTRSELEAGVGDDPIGRLYANGFHPERSPDLLVQLDENVLFLPFEVVATSHGSPYAYDTHVPWLLLAPGRSGSVVGQRVETVDVAPTVAELAGIPVPASVDGTSRVPLLADGR